MTLSKEDIKSAVGEAIDEKMGKLYVDREQHFLDHQLVKGVRSGVGTMRTAGLKVLGVAIVGFIGWSIVTWIIEVVKRGTPS